MSDALKIKRTWRGLICPVCRLVFRVPKDHEGHGVICPACSHLLNLPEAKVELNHDSRDKQKAAEDPKSLAPSPRDKINSKQITARSITDQDMVTNADASADNVGHRKRRRKSQSDQKVGWDERKEISTRGEGSAQPWIIGGSILGLLIVGIGAWLVIDSLKHDPSDETIAPTAKAVPDSGALSVQDDMKSTSEQEIDEPKITGTWSAGLNLLADAEVAARKFLNAKSLDEMAQHVRRPEITIPRMRQWYGDAPWIPFRFKKIGRNGKIDMKGANAFMPVQLMDYTYRQISLHRVGNDYKVDWESWVVWSSMRWNDLFLEKPEEPVEIRVSCIIDYYYNRLFRDETKWLAVRLQHPYQDRIIYGYVDKQSPSFTSFMTSLQKGASFAATLKVKFPKNSIADNQVEIVEFLQNGWRLNFNQDEVEKN